MTTPACPTCGAATVRRMESTLRKVLDELSGCGSRAEFEEAGLRMIDEIRSALSSTPAPAANRQRCMGCGSFYEEVDPTKACEAYDTAGHDFVDVDENGFALPASAVGGEAKEGG